MTTVAPAHMRSEVSEGPRALAFSIPTRRHWLLIFPLAMWLAMWSLAILFGLVGLLVGGVSGASLLTFFTWFLFGVPFLVICVWLLFGKERVVLRGSTLTHRYDWAFGLGRERVYDLDHVRNLRLSPPPTDFWAPRAALRMLDLAGGAIAFDYGARTIQFGTGIDEPEARMIIDRVLARHPIPSD